MRLNEHAVVLLFGAVALGGNSAGSSEAEGWGCGWFAVGEGAEMEAGGCLGSFWGVGVARWAGWMAAGCKSKDTPAMVVVGIEFRRSIYAASSPHAFRPFRGPCTTLHDHQSRHENLMLSSASLRITVLYEMLNFMIAD